MRNLFDSWTLLSWRQKLAVLILGVAIVVLLLSLLSSCGGKATEPFKDAPVENHNSDPAEILEMPDGFSNIATKCDGHGHRVYSAFHGDNNYGALTAVDDPSCSGGVG